jgi:hypothetical protein
MRMGRTGKMIAVLVTSALWIGSPTWGGKEFVIDEDTRVEVGFWTQAWAQFAEGVKGDDQDLNDFMLRRAYLNVKGEVSPRVSFFTHLAADRIGQEGLDNSGMGLGSGIAFRDLWITMSLNEAFKIQVGRMYVPLTRNYGTTSTKALLTTDLPFLQGGVRGNILYASKVGRDDGVALWGNPWDGKLQYRLMVSEGVENDSNPDDHLRFVGRCALNLLEPETGWFNKGTYLGKKKVLSLGAGYDTQDGLTLAGMEDRDSGVWTADVFFDYPVGEGAVTAEAAFISIENGTQTHNFSELAAGDDAENWYIQTGYLIPGTVGQGRLQPYMRYETIDVDGKGATDYAGVGFNYYLKGHNSKISVDYTHVDWDLTEGSQGILTFQLAIGF